MYLDLFSLTQFWIGFNYLESIRIGSDCPCILVQIPKSVALTNIFKKFMFITDSDPWFQF